MRRRLPPPGADGRGVRMYTGDDFNYAELIAGDGVGTAPTQQHSDALLGIFDAIAPAASAALAALAGGDTARFHAILEPTVPLSRHIFQAPTRFYKTGVVFMAWLNGHQNHFVMVGGQQSTRSLPHLAELFRLADAAGLIEQPELAAGAHEDAAGAAWRAGLNGNPQIEPMRDFSADHRWLSINTATVRRQRGAGLAAAGHPRRLRGARHPRRVALARPGGRGRAGCHGAATARAGAGAVGLLPRRHVHLRRRRRAAGRPRRQPARARRGLRAGRALPGAGGRRPARRAGRPGRAPRHRRRARAGGTRASPRCWKMRASAACRWPSSRCTRCTPPTAPASTRWNRRWTCAMRSTRSAQRRARRGGRRLPRLVGPEAAAADRARGRATGCWPSMSATGSCRRATCSTTAA